MIQRSGGGIGCGAYFVQQTRDDGFIICGETRGGSDHDIYLIKTDFKGDTLWTKNFGGTDDEWPSCVKQTNDGGYIITGYTYSFGSVNGSAYVIKTDSSGNIRWSKIYGGTAGESASLIQQTYDGGYILAGNSWSFGAGNDDMYLVKADTSGNIIWTKTFGGTDFDYANAIEQTGDSGYIVAGVAGAFGAGSDDFYLVKTNAGGDTLWTRTYGGTDIDQANAVKQTSDGGYIIAGRTLSFGANYYDAYIVKTNANGSLMWSRIYGGHDYESINAVEQTTDGGFLLAGTTGSFGSGTSNALIIKTDSLGFVSWTKGYGGIRNEGAYSAQQTTDGGYILAGNTTSFSTDSSDIYLVKSDANGNSGCNEIDTTWQGISVATIVGRPHTIVSSGGVSVTVSTLSTVNSQELSLCSHVGINEIINDGKLVVFPNPSSSTITITIPGNSQNKESTVSITNVLGATIQSEKQLFTKDFSFDIRTFSPGIYFVKLVDSSNSECFGRFVKQ